MEEGVHAGFFRYLAKPIQVHEFLDTWECCSELRHTDTSSGVARNKGVRKIMIDAADILNAPILVVDDKEANVELLQGMLRVAGYTSVHSTTDPKAVCALHRKNRYSLILLVLQMPEMNGFQVMEGLKEIETDGYLPVLVLTAHPDHKLRALEAGAKDFLSKPFDLAELRARLHNLLEVRLLHLESKANSKALDKMMKELEASRQRELALAQETQKALLPRFIP